MFKRKTRSKKNKIHFCHFRQIIILSFVCTNNHLSTSTAVVTKTKHYHFFTDLKSQDTYTIWTLLRCKLFVKWGKKTSLLHLGSLPVTSVGPLWFNTKVLTSSQGYRTLSCKKKWILVWIKKRAIASGENFLIVMDGFPFHKSMSIRNIRMSEPPATSFSRKSLISFRPKNKAPKQILHHQDANFALRTPDSRRGRPDNSLFMQTLQQGACVGKKGGTWNSQLIWSIAICMFLCQHPNIVLFM